MTTPVSSPISPTTLGSRDPIPSLPKQPRPKPEALGGIGHHTNQPASSGERASSSCRKAYESSIQSSVPEVSPSQRKSGNQPRLDQLKAELKDLFKKSDSLQVEYHKANENISKFSTTRGRAGLKPCLIGAGIGAAISLTICLAIPGFIGAVPLVFAIIGTGTSMVGYYRGRGKFDRENRLQRDVVYKALKEVEKKQETIGRQIKVRQDEYRTLANGEIFGPQRPIKINQDPMAEWNFVNE